MPAAYLAPASNDDQRLTRADGDEEDPASAAADRTQESRKEAARWQRELAASKKWMERFETWAKTCERAYFNEGNSDDAGARPGQNRSRVNLFWSNTQVVLSSIYARLPRAEVYRKFRDYEDDVARVASMMLERLLNADLERESDDTNSAMRDAVQDRFICGLGTVWCRYDVETEQTDSPKLDPMTGQPALDPVTGQPLTETLEKIVNEEAATDYVYWADFRYAPCRRWRSCRWAARRVYMRKRELQKRFNLNDAQLANIPMVGTSPAGTTGDSGVQIGREDVLRATPFQQAPVWEIWDKDTRRVFWVCEGCDYCLDIQDDLLHLEDFFPCPPPITATTLTKAFLPKPDYIMAQSLYRELDRVNDRLSELQSAVRATGAYDKNSASLKTILTSQIDNGLIPVENWSSFTEKGGIKGVIDWVPIEAFTNAINQLNMRKSQLEGDLYELLGISDIMRGTSAASETLGAQKLKAAYGGARLDSLQSEVARFVSAVSRIRADIVCSQFQDETIVRRSLMDKTSDAQLVPQALALLRECGVSMVSIKVDADTIAAPDWDAEKESRTELMGATSNLLMAAAPILQQSPEVGGLLLKLLQWSVAGFRGGRSIEGAIDQAVAAFEAKAQQPPPPPPPPSPRDQRDMAMAKKASAEADAVQITNQKTTADAGKSLAEADRTRAETAIMSPDAQSASMLAAHQQREAARIAAMQAPPQVQMPQPPQPPMGGPPLLPPGG